MSGLIGRQAISAWLYNMGHEKLSEYVLDEKRFPSEDRPTGKWVPNKIMPHTCLDCSECGYHHIQGVNTANSFCPNCGADMKGATDGNK